MCRRGFAKTIRPAICIAAFIILALDCSEMETKWSRKFDVFGPGSYRINGLSSSKKEIYLTGTYTEDNQGTKCFTARYDPDGSLNWYKLYDTPDAEQAAGVAMSVIRTQEELLAVRCDIYVLVEIRNTAGHEKVMLVKYDSLGDVQWQKKVTEHKGSIASRFLSDYNGNLYVAGWKTDVDNKATLYIGKYTESGETSWFTTYYNEQIVFEVLNFDITEPDYFVVAGLSKNTSEFFYMKYDSTGQFQRLIRSETENRVRQLSDLKIGPEGNIFITATISNLETGDDLLTVAYDKEDSLLWSNEYDGDAHGNDVSRFISVDELSNIYVTGKSENAEGITVIVTIKYDLIGDQVWAQSLTQKDAVEPFFMEPRYLRLGERAYLQHLYVVGTIENNTLIALCNTNGFFSWHKQHSAADKVTKPTALSPPYLAMECSADGRSDALLVKYGPSEILGLTRWD